MLYGALLLQQARLTAEGHGLGLWIGSLILVAILVFFVPYYVVRIRRAQRYAREHADLLRTGQSSPR
jgi:Flp pilus assembly protein TadB